MNGHEELPEGHLHWTKEEYNDSRKDSLRTILILSVVTIVEVGIALLYDNYDPAGEGVGKIFINIFMAVASIVKVYYIMGTFMHLKHETKEFLWTVFIPFTILIWAIIAFALEGESWRYMRSLLNVF